MLSKHGFSTIVGTLVLGSIFLLWVEFYSPQGREKHNFEAAVAKGKQLEKLIAGKLPSRSYLKTVDYAHEIFNTISVSKYP